MVAEGLLREVGTPTDEELDDALASNLCRCGAYAGIREAVKSVAAASIDYSRPRSDVGP
jgi:aerobic-type carbon monoxide dehydrogenase small subunit (CoxS/CutS family)